MKNHKENRGNKYHGQRNEDRQKKTCDSDHNKSNENAINVCITYTHTHNCKRKGEREEWCILSTIGNNSQLNGPLVQRAQQQN